MEARTRNVETWFSQIASGKLRLPRFQRYEAWNYSTISSFLESILNGLPVGVALLLEIGDKELFHSRPLKGTVETTERCTEHLLDGQQRLTALWRALNNDYDDRVFLISQNEDGETSVSPHWPRTWMGDPVQCWDKGFVPVYLCRPGTDGEQKARQWKEEAAGRGFDALSRYQEISDVVDKYRHRFGAANIPFLSLPSSTSSDTAIDVFVRMNTSNVRLTAFDIVVAQFEAKTGESLHDRLEAITTQVPRLADYRANIENVLLHVAALREGKPLRKSSFLGLNLENLLGNFPDIEKGITFAADILRSERVFDAARLPTTEVISVLAALHPHLPSDPDRLGNAMMLVRGYLWRAFTTNRYESGSNTGTLQDLKGMIEKLRGRTNTAHIFDEDRYPLPSAKDIVRAGWPRRRIRLSRAVLCASLRHGALDLASGSAVNSENIMNREYHHLFPKAYLKKHTRNAERAERALNCILISPATNRKISAKAPLAYLQDRIDNADLGEGEIRRRLKSHLVPWEEFTDLKPTVARSYSRFLEARAELVFRALTDLCNGAEPQRK